MKSRLKRIFLWLCVDLFGGLFRLIGLADILRKFQTVEDSRKHPAGFLGAVGIFALFGLAGQPYQGEHNRLISRVDQIRGGAVSGDQSRWLKQTAPAQSGETRTAPVFWPPGQTIKSFFGVKEKNPETTRQPIKIAEAKRDDLAGAKLAGHNFKGADLERANLTEADLKGANLAGAQLAGANLAGAKLAGAQLAGADLAGADLAGANLKGANLTEANLEGANLKGTNLAGAIIYGARFDGAENLACRQLESATFKKETDMFDGMFDDMFYDMFDDMSGGMLDAMFGNKKLETFPSYLNVSWNEDGVFLGCRPQK